MDGSCKRILIVVGILMVLVAAASALWLTVFAQPKPTPVADIPATPPTFTQEVSDPVVEEEPPEPEPVLDDPYYVLLVGSDSRSRDLTGTRSDAILLIRVDEKTPQLTVVSLLRDTLAAIPGHGSEKVNAAFAYGGIDLTEQAVEQLLGVDIRYNAVLGFATTTELVDHLGGVTIDVDVSMSYKGVDVSAGLQTLDGKHALTFARCRKELLRGDFHRVEHHRDLFIATFDKLVHSDTTDYPALAAGMLPYLQTNIPADKAVHLLTVFKDFDSTTLHEATAPSYSGPYNGASYVFLEEENWVAMLGRIEQGLPPVE